MLQQEYQEEYAKYTPIRDDLMKLYQVKSVVDTCLLYTYIEGGDMFIGREKELEGLEKLYQTECFQFPVIYGRRRVGKTALINQFVQGKEAIYFTGVESNERQNLENFSKSIWNYTSDADLGSSPIFPSFQAALEYVFQLAEKKRLVLVIDEYPYVARASKSLASTLQL